MAIVRRANDFRNFFRTLATEVRQASLTEAFNRPYLESTATRIIRRIKDRTQVSGFGVTNGRQRKLRPLARETREKRTFLRGLGILSSRTSPATSNLTERGQMFDSLDSRVNARERSILIYFNNREADRKAAAVSVRRPFLELTNNDINNYRRDFDVRLAKILARRTRNL